MKFLSALLIVVLGIFASAAAASLQPLSGPVSDPAGLLSKPATDEILAAASVFKKATGDWMVLVALPKPDSQATSALAEQLVAPWDKARLPASVGIVYVMSPEAKSGTLLIVDPAWRQAFPQQWSLLFPQHLAEKYGDEPFERRAVLSAQYLSTVFADKVAFVLKPRGGELSPGSVRFAQGSYIGLAILGYFIVFFTVFRTFWPARLRDEDHDEVSEEIRRLQKERQIW